MAKKVKSKSKSRITTPTDICKGWSIAYCIGMTTKGVESSIVLDPKNVHQKAVFGRILDNLLEREHTWSVGLVGVYRSDDGGFDYLPETASITTKCTRSQTLDSVQQFHDVVLDIDNYENFHNLVWVISPGRREFSDLELIRIAEDQVKAHLYPKVDWDGQCDKLDLITDQNGAEWHRTQHRVSLDPIPEKSDA